MSISNSPAIIVMTYNRDHSLQRLLDSLSKAIYNSNTVSLIISIDGAKEKENQGCIDLAEKFTWNNGEKRIVNHEKNIGIINHAYYCLGLTSEFGSVILLEEDQYVSPIYYKYSREVLKFYEKEQNIFCFSLFAHSKNGYLDYPFFPLQEDNDVFFMQLGFTQGIVITERQWNSYNAWLSTSNNWKITLDDPFHPYLLELDKIGTEWFQTITKYLYTSNKFIGFPRVSLSVNFHDTGTHNKNQSSWYQVPLSFENSSFVFKSLENTNAVYDSYMEIFPDRLKRLNNELTSYNFEVDLLALKTKKIIKTEYLLSTREVKDFKKSFALLMKPMEQNITEKIEGEGIYLAEKENFKFTKLKDAKIRRRNYYFYNTGRKKKSVLTSAIIGILSKLRII